MVLALTIDYSSIEGFRVYPADYARIHLNRTESSNEYPANRQATVQIWPDQ
jgi:molybdopterin-guanine dinucleotide biosynthesis protein